MDTAINQPDGLAPSKPGDSLPGDQRRLEDVQHQLFTAFSDSVRLFLLLVLILFASGEFGLETAQENGSNIFRFVSVSDTLPLWLFGILCWDIIFFLVTRFFFPGNPIDEPLLGLGLVIFLWRLVWLNFTMFLQPSIGTLPASPTSWTAVFLFFTVLITGKELIARKLLHQDKNHRSPLLAVWGWHNRKDAVFSILFLTGWWLHHILGVQPYFIHLTGSLFRALLLGSAALAITRRGITAIRTIAADHESESVATTSKCP